MSVQVNHLKYFDENSRKTERNISVINNRQYGV